MFLVTGASGFVGRALCLELLRKGIAVRAGLRRDGYSLPIEVVQYNVGEFSEKTSWMNALSGVDVVIHTAARVHVMNDQSNSPLEDFREVNTRATLNLARQAAKAGVKRFVFLSSIKVNGEVTSFGSPFTPDDHFIPSDPYGISKFEAEQGLFALADEIEMEIVVIRPPLVYGPGVKANFASMMKWVYKGIPLPFGSINNKRSLVALENLINFIIHCSDYKNIPQARNEIFLISDNEDVSTTELLEKVGRAFGGRAFLLPISSGLMLFFARLMGKADLVDRLFGSLQVDSSKAAELLGWKPVVTMDEQLKKTAMAFLDEKNI